MHDPHDCNRSRASLSSVADPAVANAAFCFGAPIALRVGTLLPDSYQKSIKHGRETASVVPRNCGGANSGTCKMVVPNKMDFAK